MDPTRIVLAACWVSLMLVYLLGDVLHIFAGHFTPGRMAGREAAGLMWTRGSTTTSSSLSGSC